jgi:hypothetical protein
VEELEEKISERVLNNRGLRVWIAVMWLRTDSSGIIRETVKKVWGSVKGKVYLSSVIFYLCIYLYVVLYLLHESFLSRSTDPLNIDLCTMTYSSVLLLLLSLVPLLYLYSISSFCLYAATR